MTRSEIEQQLKALVLQEKNVADELLTPGTALADAGIDSLDSLTILFAIEEHFHISIPDDRARAMRTFGDLADIIASRIENGPAGIEDGPAGIEDEGLRIED